MISKNAILETEDLQIGKNVVIGDNVEIRCPEKIHIGDNSVLTKDIKINCTSFEAGEYLFMCERVEIGRGGDALVMPRFISLFPLHRKVRVRSVTGWLRYRTGFELYRWASRELYCLHL